VHPRSCQRAIVPVSVPLSCHRATVLSSCHCPVSVPLSCQHATVLSACHFPLSVPLSCQHATVLSACHCPASVPLSCQRTTRSADIPSGLPMRHQPCQSCSKPKVHMSVCHLSDRSITSPKQHQSFQGACQSTTTVVLTGHHHSCQYVTSFVSAPPVLSNMCQQASSTRY
jgi:hypothetical protein